MKDKIDIQSQVDKRNITIDKVGVKKVRYPIIVEDRENGIQNTVAELDIFVELPHHHRGTHMSRFIEVLNKFHKENFAEGAILRVKESPFAAMGASLGGRDHRQSEINLASGGSVRHVKPGCAEGGVVHQIEGVARAPVAGAGVFNAPGFIKAGAGLNCRTVGDGHICHQPGIVEAGNLALQCCSRRGWR